MEIGTTSIELQGGTFLYDSNSRPLEYIEVGISPNGNRIVFDYADILNVTNYVSDIVENLPDNMTNYLSYILDTTVDTIVRLWYSPNDEATSFDIYFDTDCQSNDILNLVGYLNSHNDFAASNNKYTKIKNGHQVKIEE